jgi:hypothetical protein
MAGHSTRSLKNRALFAVESCEGMVRTSFVILNADTTLDPGTRQTRHIA